MEAGSRIENVDRIPVLCTKDLTERIDDWRYANRVPSRAEAVRRLLVRGLEASAEDQRKG